jgi:cell division protein FtsA
MAELIFEMPVKRGYPNGIGGLREIVNSPKYATGVGILRHVEEGIKRQKLAAAEARGYAKVRYAMSNWIKDFF